MTIIEKANSVIVRNQHLADLNAVQGEMNDLQGLSGAVTQILQDIEILSSKYQLIQEITPDEELQRITPDVESALEELRDFLNAHINNADNLTQQTLQAMTRNFTNVLSPIISNLWNSHAEVLKGRLIGIHDLSNYRNILPEMGELIQEIRNARQTVFNQVNQCPNTIQRYGIVLQTLNNTVNLQNNLLNHFPENVRPFLKELYENNGANIDNFTQEVEDWFNENGLINNLCIKLRQ